eukprot:gnl/TRDRNA2_/TRDRNA2_177580_c1_seq4.p1 gnl/TRDRNA2_/TRDRNA2_177580_c1~~gnl/TRDRNA2_/TRDRNA2_177580_c1_seq4.p1  ORF type:complete len:363 (-),score=-46.67 gnl/TRDRNA2_/TRDRNA2_177580_c1_seq4:109-1197(-)
MLPSTTILYVLYLGLFYLKYNVMSQDLIDWTLQGILSIHQILQYSSLAKFFLNSKTGFLIPFSESLQIRFSISGGIFFNKKARELFFLIGLYAPNSITTSIYKRIIEDLDLSHQLFIPLIVLDSINEITEFSRFECTKFPVHTRQIGVLLITLKLLYGLDGYPRPIFSNCLPPEVGWESWSLSLLHDLIKPVKFSPFFKTLKSEKKKNMIKSYISHCKKQIFSVSTKCRQKVKTEYLIKSKEMYDSFHSYIFDTNSFSNLRILQKKITSPCIKSIFGTTYRIKLTSFSNCLINNELVLDSSVEYGLCTNYNMYSKKTSTFKHCLKTFVINSSETVAVTYVLGRYQGIRPSLILDLLWKFKVC